jgi:hypothetical protein
MARYWHTQVAPLYCTVVHDVAVNWSTLDAVYSLSDLSVYYIVVIGMLRAWAMVK